MTQSASKGNAPVRLTILILLALIGMGFSIYLTSHYYDLRSGVASFKSSCNISNKLNCDVVAASPYAEIFSGVPLSSITTGWYLGLLVIYALGFSRDWWRQAVRGALFMTGVASVATVYYLAIMATALHTYCLFCLFIDVVNLLSLILVLTLQSRGPTGEHFLGARWKAVAGIAAGCVLVSVVALKGMDQLNGHAGELDEMANEVLSSPPVEVGSDASNPSIGPRDAPITIVEFSDFQCPFCRMEALSLNTVMDRYPGKIRLVFRNFPLDPSCNRFVPHGMHQFACEAARVGICASKQGKFKPYYEDVYENQKDLGSGVPASMAQSVGVNSGELTACVNDPATTQAISQDIEEGNRLGVQSTPTLFVNGHRVEGALPPPAWAKIIDTLLKNQPPRGT